MDFKTKHFVLILQIAVTFFLSAADSQTQLEHFTAAATNLSSELYQHSIESTFDGNVVISPYSAVNALVLLSQAANRRTLYQLKKSLNFTDTKSDLLDSYVTYANSMKESACNSTFIVANKLYVQKGYQLNEKFQEMAKNQLSSGVEMIDFTNLSEAAKVINNFVAEKTQNKTGNVIQSLNPDTRIILTNTIYMNLRWENVYQHFFVYSHMEDTFTSYYPNSYTRYKWIEYVSFLDGWFKYADLKDLNAKAIEIRFSDSDFSLLMILPDAHSHIALLETEAKLKNYDLTKIIDRMRPEKVDVQIPTFKIKYQVRLKDLSSRVRVSNIFETDKADFSELLNNDSLTPVSDAILTTVIELKTDNIPDQKTRKFLYILSHLYSNDHKRHFKAVRPFFFHILNRKLNAPILSGCLKEFKEKNGTNISLQPDGHRCYDDEGNRVTCELYI